MRAIETSSRGLSKARVWNGMGGPLLAVGVAVAIAIVARAGFTIPNPPAVLLLVVVFAAFIGGLGSGLVTALIAWLSFLYLFSSPGQLFHYTDDNLRRVVIWAVTTPIMACMVGVLKHRAERGVQALRESAIMAERITERRQAEEVLRESEARFRDLFESVPVGLCRTTPGGQILAVNTALVRILGYPDQDTLRVRNMADMYFDPQERARRANQVGREGHAKFEAYQMRRYDGTPVWVETSGRATYDSEGRVLYFDGVIMDVTDRKREEDARRRWAAIVESSDDAIIGKNLEGIIESWNPGAEIIYGYAAAEVVGRSISLLVPPDRPDEIPNILQRLRRGERVEHFETVRVRKDGSRIDVSLTISPIRDAKGNIIGASTLARDISARKRQEEALRKSEERYRGLFNGIPMGLYRTTVEGEILEANPAFLKMLGCPHLETLRAMGARGLYVDPDARRRWIDALEKEGVVSGFESQLRRFDGSVIWVAASARIVQDPRGGSYLEGAVEDITQRKEVQEATLRAREADRANQAKSEFLSRMSHELRTPLNAILGFGQLLEMDSLTPKQHENVEDILKGGRHLLELINEVLDIARIEAGRLTLSPEPVSVHELVQESLSLIAPLAAQQSIRLEGGAARIPDQFVQADRQRLKQVVLNLLSNAVKYNRSGGLVALSCETLPEGRLRIKVSDTGPGISPERLKHLFVPFERLGAEQTAVEGTGLGLALSKRLVEAMGGTLGVDSIVDRGSVFWIELALAETPAQHVSTVTGNAADLPASRPAGTVLYIEDNLSNLKLVQSLLALRPEVRVIAAMQGRLGLDLARQHRPELILLDVHLPDMRGDEVLRRLHDAPETRRIPVVVISADATRGQIDRLLAAGARAYLTKPLDVKKLLAVLDEVLTQGPLRRQKPA